MNNCSCVSVCKGSGLSFLFSATTLHMATAKVRLSTCENELHSKKVWNFGNFNGRSARSGGVKCVARQLRRELVDPKFGEA